MKLPLTRDGISACSTLSKEGIRSQCNARILGGDKRLLAAKAGAYIVSPFVGRLDDIGMDGMELVQQIVQIYDNYGYKTQILAASLRTPNHVIASAMAGAHIGTMPFKVVDQLFNHPLTDRGLEQFLNDWGKVFQEPAAFTIDELSCWAGLGRGGRCRLRRLNRDAVIVLAAQKSSRKRTPSPENW